MKHTIEMKTNTSTFTEKLEFEDSLNGTKTELTCDWSLNAGILTNIGIPIAEQLENMGFDSSVTTAYTEIYSNNNMQSLVMMMFAGIM